MSQPFTGQYSQYNVYCFLTGQDKQTNFFQELIAVLPFLSEKEIMMNIVFILNESFHCLL